MEYLEYFGVGILCNICLRAKDFYMLCKDTCSPILKEGNTCFFFCLFVYLFVCFGLEDYRNSRTASTFHISRTRTSNLITWFWQTLYIIIFCMPEKLEEDRSWEFEYCFNIYFFYFLWWNIFSKLCLWAQSCNTFWIMDTLINVEQTRT